VTDSAKSSNSAVPRGPVNRRIPEGDERERLVCDDCGFILYDNPKIVVGSVAVWQGGILLCRRAIEPRRGFWTLPAGYMELGETPEAGAAREAWEEARASLKVGPLLAIYSLPRISQVQLIYRAELTAPEFAPGPESEDVRLFGWDEIPWDDLAFPSVNWALHHHHERLGKPDAPPAVNPPEGL
jgi:ADP-ribose pyrophosphatase YjhB (NUDIX family)